MVIIIIIRLIINILDTFHFVLVTHLETSINHVTLITLIIPIHLW